jgi:hypothetical protein
MFVVVPVQFIGDVPALNVKFTVEEKSIGLLLLNVSVLAPSVIVLTLVLEDEIPPAVKLKFLVSNVPLVNVTKFPVLKKASDN